MRKAVYVTLWLCLFTIGCLDAKTIYDCSNRTCTNGATCSNFLLNNKAFDINCECGADTYGPDCSHCVGKYVGNNDIYNKLTPNAVRVFITITAAITMFTGLYVICTFARISTYDFKPPPGSPDAHQHEHQDEQQQLEAKQFEAKQQDVARFAYSSSKWWNQSYFIADILFFIGASFYMATAFAPKLFAGKLHVWSSNDALASWQDCRTYSAFIWSGIILICGSCWIMTCHYYVVGSSLYGYKAFASVNREGYPFVGANPELFGRFFQSMRFNSWRSTQWFVLLLLMAAVIAEFFSSYTLDERSCCQRLLTANLKDFVIGIMLVIFWGVKVFLLDIPYVTRMLFRSANISRSKERIDEFDLAYRETLLLKYIGNPSPETSWYSFRLEVTLGLALQILAIVFIILDLAGYNTNNPSIARPDQKGAIAILVITIAKGFRVLVFHYNASAHACSTSKEDDFLREQSKSLQEIEAQKNVSSCKVGFHNEWHYAIPRLHRRSLHPLVDDEVLLNRIAEKRYISRRLRRALKNYGMEAELLSERDDQDI